jgi:hypothetical protein
VALASVAVRCSVVAAAVEQHQGTSPKEQTKWRMLLTAMVEGARRARRKKKKTQLRVLLLLAEVRRWWWDTHQTEEAAESLTAAVAMGDWVAEQPVMTSAAVVWMHWKPVVGGQMLAVMVL